MNAKYNKVILLVHPLYSIINELRINQNIKIKNQTDARLEIIKTPNLDKELNYLIKEYKNVITKIKKTQPDALLIVINPRYLPNPVGSYKQGMYSKIITPLDNFCKAKLKENYLRVTYQPKIEGIENLLPEKMYTKLDRNIKLYSFGEFYHACVKNWLDYAHIELKNRHFNVLEARILPTYSLTIPGNNTPIDFRLILNRQRYLNKKQVKVKATRRLKTRFA